MSRGKKKFAIAIAVFVLASAYLAYSGARGSMAYYLTVGELLDRAPAITGSSVRLNGKVLPGVDWDQVSGRPGFTVTHRSPQDSRALPRYSARRLQTGRGGGAGRHLRRQDIHRDAPLRQVPVQIRSQAGRRVDE